MVGGIRGLTGRVTRCRLVGGLPCLVVGEEGGAPPTGNLRCCEHPAVLSRPLRMAGFAWLPDDRCPLPAGQGADEHSGHRPMARCGHRPFCEQRIAGLLGARRGVGQLEKLGRRLGSSESVGHRPDPAGEVRCCREPVGEVSCCRDGARSLGYCPSSKVRPPVPVGGAQQSGPARYGCPQSGPAASSGRRSGSAARVGQPPGPARSDGRRPELRPAAGCRLCSAGGVRRRLRSAWTRQAAVAGLNWTAFPDQFRSEGQAQWRRRQPVSGWWAGREPGAVLLALRSGGATAPVSKRAVVAGVPWLPRSRPERWIPRGSSECGAGARHGGASGPSRGGAGVLGGIPHEQQNICESGCGRALRLLGSC